MPLDNVQLILERRGATRLYPLTDYEPRKGEALEQGHLADGHGAAPVVPSGFPHRPDR